MVEHSAPDRAARAAAQLRPLIWDISRRLRLSPRSRELSPTQLLVLAAIAHRPSQRLSELGSAVGINATLLSRVAAKLEAAALVERASDPADGRVVRLTATPPGRRLLSRIEDQQDAALAAAVRRLPASGLDSLSSAMPSFEVVAEALREGR